MSTLRKAIEIAVIAHKDQVDKAGKPYVCHLIAVMSQLDDEQEKILAMFHDLVEDTSWTFEMLEKEGFSSIIGDLKLLTRRPQDSYSEFIDRVKSSYRACKVKLSDLQDNMQLDRLSHPNDKDIKRAQKYKKHYDDLEQYCWEHFESKTYRERSK